LPGWDGQNILCLLGRRWVEGQPSSMRGRFKAHISKARCRAPRALHKKSPTPTLSSRPERSAVERSPYFVCVGTEASMPLRYESPRNVTFLCKAVAPGWMHWFWGVGFLGVRVVAGRGRRFSRFGCACAPACGSVEPTHAAKARHEWGTRLFGG